MAAEDSPVSEEQLAKAIVAILRHLTTHKKHDQLFDDAEYLYLVLALTKLPRGRKDKPVRLPLSHRIYSQDSQDVCLFVKDHKGEGHKAAKERLAQQPQCGIKKVVGLSKLRTKYEAFEAKRQLCDSYDLFLADERILPSLPKLIGKSFFKKKKQPVPVRASTKNWRVMVQQALSGTYFYPSPGNCLSIKFALSSMSPEECLANALAVLTAVVRLIPGGWRNVRAIHAKSAESLALPVWQVLPKSRLKPAAEAKQPAGDAEAGAEASAQAAPAPESKLARKLAQRKVAKALRGKRQPGRLLDAA